MALQNQFLLGSLSNVIIRADGKDVNVSDFVEKLSIKESIFVPYVRGSITLRESTSVDFLRRISLKGGPEGSVSFSFSGIQDNQRNKQPEISVTHENYKIYDVKILANDRRQQIVKVFFVSKYFWLDLNKKVSRGYDNVRISDIIEHMGNEHDIEWNEIEPTENSITTALPYNTPFSHIATLTKYSIRKDNINDVNYVFWENLNNKYNFVSLGKLFEQPPAFGKDINSGFIYGENNNLSVEQAKRLVLKHSPIGKSSLETSLSGAYSSGIVFIDPVYPNRQKYISFNSKENWHRSTHLSMKPKNENNSEFWNFSDDSMFTRVYCTNTNGYCCNEEEGGQRNVLFAAQRRTSQISNFFEFGVKLIVTGNSNQEEVGAGKIFYFGRPLRTKPLDASEEDIHVSGKFLATTVSHVIFNTTKRNYKYITVINGFKDSIGEE